MYEKTDCYQSVFFVLKNHAILHKYIKTRTFTD